MAVVSKDLLWRLLRAEHESTKQYLGVWASVEGNPRKVDFIERPWGTIFFLATSPTNTVFNRASGLGESVLGHLDEIESEFAKREVPPVIEVSAADLSGDFKEEAMAGLVDRGFRLHDVEGLYFGETDRQYLPPAKDVEIRQVMTKKEMAIFLDVYARGWGTPEEAAKLWKSVGGQMLDDPKFSAWLSYSDGQPAGCAQLYLHEGVGYFADACVVEEFRRRGCQRALFNARLEEARTKGADLIFSIAEFADQSANNMEAWGLRMATELWHWRKPD